MFEERLIPLVPILALWRTLVALVIEIFNAVAERVSRDCEFPPKNSRRIIGISYDCRIILRLERGRIRRTVIRTGSVVTNKPIFAANFPEILFRLRIMVVDNLRKESFCARAISRRSYRIQLLVIHRHQVFCARENECISFFKFFLVVLITRNALGGLTRDARNT